MVHPRKCVNHATLSHNCVTLSDSNRSTFTLFFDGNEMENLNNEIIIGLSETAKFNLPIVRK